MKIGFWGFSVFLALAQGFELKAMPSRCADLVKGSLPKLDFENPDKNWIRENLLIGIERTYGNRVIDGMIDDAPYVYHYIDKETKEFHSLLESKSEQQLFSNLLVGIRHKLTQKNVFTRSQVKEVLRFFTEVLKASRLTLFVGTPSREQRVDHKQKLGYQPHYQVVTALVEISIGKYVVVTLEPSSIEVNRPPSDVEDLVGFWDQVDSAAVSSGFYPNFYHGGHGGGGTHFNLGWRSVDQNLWLGRPDVLAGFLQAPIYFKSLLMVLGEYSDFGHGSSVQLPHEVSDEHSSQWNKFVGELYFLRNLRAEPEEVVKWAESSSNPILIHDGQNAHDSYISLKKFLTDNPFVEYRAVRGLKDSGEIGEVANLFVDLLYEIWSGKLGSKFRINPTTFRESMIDIGFLSKLNEFKSLMNEMDVSKERQERLLSLGGERIESFYGYNIKHKSITAAPRVLHAFSPPGFVRPSETVQLHFDFSGYPPGTVIQIFSHEKAKFLKNEHDYFEHSQVGGNTQYLLGVVLNARHEVLNRFAVEIKTYKNSKSLEIRAPLKLEELYRDPDLYQRLVPCGVSYFNAFDADSKNESLQYDYRIDAPIYLHFPELRKILSQYSGTSLFRNLDLVVPLEFTAKKIWINGYEAKFWIKKYGGFSQLRIDLPVQYLEKIQAKIVSGDPSFLFVSTDSPVKEYDFFWAKVEGREDYSEMIALELSVDLSYSRQKEILDGWVNDFSLCCETKIHTLKSVYSGILYSFAFPDELIQRLKTYEEKLTGSLDP